MRTPADAPEPILVVFEPHTSAPRPAWLKKGFAHCFALKKLDRSWILLDPLATTMRVEHAGQLEEIPLAAAFAALGASVAIRAGAAPAGPTSTERRLARLRPLTCVEVLKRLLGVHPLWLFTPYQLFTRLRAE